MRISDWSSDVCSSDLGGVIAAVLLQRSRRLIAASRRLPAPNEAQKKANRSIWIKFWINFVFEIVLLNIAITLLSAPSQQVYWVPAISLVVGLHFLPMARFMNVPSYWFCGVVLMLGAAATAFAIGSRAAAPTLLVALESLFNAMVLWATAARSEEHTSELQSLMRRSYAVFCLK